MTIVESLVPSKVPVMLCIFVKHINTCTRGEDVARFFFLKKWWIKFWLCWVFVAAWAFLLLQWRGAAFRSRVQALEGACLSSQGPWGLLGSGSQPVLLWGIRDLPRLGTGPMSPAFAGRIFTTWSTLETLIRYYSTQNDFCWYSYMHSMTLSHKPGKSYSIFKDKAFLLPVFFQSS